MNLALGLVSRDAGGAEFQACLLAHGLTQRGHSVSIYCTDPAESVPMLMQFPGLPTRIVARGPRLGPLRHLWEAVHFKRWLHRDRIDAAVGFLGLPHALLTWAALRTRTRLYGRRSCVWSECSGYGTYDANVLRLQRWVRRWGWRTTALVCNTEAVRSSAYHVEGWTPQAKLPIIPNGWPEYPANDCRAVTPYYVARLRPEKAVDLACRRFAQAGVPLALSVEPPDWREVGILVHASRADALSNSVGMAMAHGIPVLAFDLPGNRELLGEDACVRRWRYEVMASAVQGLQADPTRRKMYGRGLRDRVRTHFSLKAMVDGWENLLNGGERCGN